MKPLKFQNRKTRRTKQIKSFTILEGTVQTIQAHTHTKKKKKKKEVGKKEGRKGRCGEEKEQATERGRNGKMK